MLRISSPMLVGAMTMLLAVRIGLAAELPPAASRTIDFVAEVQPLFKTRCFSCHGAEKQEGGLRLDRKKRALEGGDSGAAIVPGKSAESRLIHLVAGADKDAGIMPPDGEGTPLTADQIGVLRVWIDQGAKWPDEADAALAKTDHWSFRPIARPPLPPVKAAEWVRNPIDAFVLARLERDGIAPSPPADRSTLIRRLYLDLLGLPPSPREVEEFLRDERSDAYERLVDRVLESDHFGERWGRHWLDLARYADSDGYEKDNPRPHAWRYRQWVIEAINADLPFDRFSIEQIAGDLLPDAGLSQRIASGFHRNTLHNTEGGADQEEDRVKKTVDRTNTLGTIWLGLTIGCANCHSHKYDPITQREYFSLYAFFNSIQEIDVPAPTPAEQQAYDAAKTAFDAEQTKLAAALAEYERDQQPAAQAAWEKTAVETSTIWTTLDLENMQSAKGATLTRQDDQSVLAGGANLLSDIYTVEATVADKRPITAIRLEVLPDKTLVKNGPGRADNGNFVLTTFRVAAKPAKAEIAFNPAQIKSARADFSQGDWDVSLAINDNVQDGWAISPQFGQRHVAVFEFASPIASESDAGTRLSIVLDQTYNLPAPHNLGRFRLSVTHSPQPASLDGLPANIAAAIAIAPAERTKEQQTAVRDHFRSIDAEWSKRKQAVEEHAKKSPPLPAAKAQAVAELSSPRETRIQIRGDFLNPGEPVTINTLSVLPAIAARGQRLDRLDLANWLFDSQNPLTARVAVNRIWQQYFGRGLVFTSDDFGSQGDRPSHPELLDWLASEFRDGGWKVKDLHRRIVTSATYRQSSATRPELESIDPENVLLARQHRRRVEAEIVRDLALAASGLLDARIGGPSVRPPQPAEYSELTYANSAKWETSKGGDRYRRGLYTFFQRTSPYPMLAAFDAPDATECEAKRSESNTPLQALTLWNDVVFFECAQGLGRRIAAETPLPTAATASTEDALRRRIEFAFLVCLSRPPREDEAAVLARLYQQQLAIASKNPDAATALLGPNPPSADIARAELAAWTIVGRALLNLDEFVTKE